MVGRALQSILSTRRLAVAELKAAERINWKETLGSRETVRTPGTAGKASIQ